MCSSDLVDEEPVEVVLLFNPQADNHAFSFDLSSSSAIKTF